MDRARRVLPQLLTGVVDPQDLRDHDGHRVGSMYRIAGRRSGSAGPPGTMAILTR